MYRLLCAPMSAVIATTAIGIAGVNHTYAEMTEFDTSLTQLSGSEFQLNDTFSMLFDLDTIYLDTNLDNVPDMDMYAGAGNFLGEYVDPEHYVLDFAIPNSGDELRPYFLGQELTAAETVDWRLSYTTTPGDPSTIRSTILSGTADYIGGGLILNITGGLEWPVNGWQIEDQGIPLGTHWAAALADFDSFTFLYSGNLSANVIPAPGVLALLGIGGIAVRRRRS